MSSHTETRITHTFPIVSAERTFKPMDETSLFSARRVMFTYSLSIHLLLMNIRRTISLIDRIVIRQSRTNFGIYSECEKCHRLKHRLLNDHLQRLFSMFLSFGELNKIQFRSSLIQETRVPRVTFEEAAFGFGVGFRQHLFVLVSL
jgi:hypothetical protein